MTSEERSTLRSDALRAIEAAWDADEREDGSGYAIVQARANVYRKLLTVLDELHAVHSKARAVIEEAATSVQRGHYVWAELTDALEALSASAGEGA